MRLELADILFAVVLLLGFALLVLWGGRRPAVWTERGSETNLNRLRGVFALEIIIGHVIRYEATLLYPMGKFMIISVAFFFFVSALGMVRSFHGKEDYLTHFLAPRAGYLLCLAVLVYLINAAADFLLPWELGYLDRNGNVVSKFLSETNWYIWWQILFYLLFYMAYRYLKKGRIAAVAAATLVLTTAAFLNGWREGFYASEMGFAAGLLYGEYCEKCHAFLHSGRGKCLTVILAGAGLSSLLLGTDSLLGMVYLRNIMCLGGIAVLLFITDSFCFDNRAIRFLGRYSVELYLLQFVFLRITEAVGWDYKIRIPAVLLGTAAASLALHPVFVLLRKKIRQAAP